MRRRWLAVMGGGGAAEAFVTSITPTIGANVIVNGDFSAWTGGNPDGFTVTQSAPNREITQVDPANAHGGGGIGALNVYAVTSGVIKATPLTAPLVAGKFYRYSVDVTKLTTGTISAGDEVEPFRTIWASSGTKAHTVFVTGNGPKNISISGYFVPTDLTIDNLSMIPLDNVFSGKITGGADFVITSNIDLVAGEAVGFVVNADSYPNPQNCVMIVLRSYEAYDSAIYRYLISIIKRVAGVWSLVSESFGLTYVAGAKLKIIKSGTGYSVGYNDIYNALSSKSATINDAGIVNNAIHFQIATHASNLFANPSHESATGKYKIFAIGDSKTVGTGGTDATAAYFKYFTNKIEYPLRYAIGGYTAGALLVGLTDALNSRSVPTPDAVLLNIGAADVIVPTSQADFETKYLSILDAVHTKWPSVPCYLMKIWKRGADAICDTFDGYIDNIIAARPTFVHSGPDERIFLKGLDDGATYTTDGVHPNDAGYALTAQEWSTILGY